MKAIKNFIGIWIGVSSLFLACSCGGPSQNQPVGGPTPVNITLVKSEQARYFDSYPANIVAINEVQIRSQVNGYITKIFFKEGQRIKVGEELYEIERNKYTANYEQAKALVQMAEANLEKTRKDAERYNALEQEEAISKQRAEYANTDYRNAKQQVASAKAELSKASNDLSHSIIKAPFNGTIGISPIKLGTFVTAGQTVLNTLSQEDPIAVDFVIAEREIPRFTELKNRKIGKIDSVFTIILPDKSKYPLPGQIDLFDRAVDPLTGTLKVRLKYINPQQLLKPGMSCILKVLNVTPGKVLLVPSKAVTEQMGEYFVYVARHDSARQKKVTIGPQVETNVIVYSGVNEGDSVITEGIQKLKEGAPIQIGRQKQNQKGKKK